MAQDYWQPGEVILMKAFLERSKPRQLLDVRPQVVVHDSPDFLATVTLPGSTWLTRDEPGRTAMPVEDRIALYITEEVTLDWYERTATRATLSLREEGKSHSILLFWNDDWSFRFWYVNLEDPYVRTPKGIEVNDHTLDIVATADLRWSWKDEPEFVALVEAGKILPDKASAIRDEGFRTIERIESHSWPFNEPWPQWRPDPSWIAPKVQDHWRPPSSA